MNKVILIGNISRDIELRYTESQKAVAQFNLAVNRPKREDGTQEADFINIVVWGKQAENINKYLHKGSKLAIEGRIQTRNYEDKDGKKVYITEVVAENVQFLDSKTKEETTPEVKQEVKVESDPYAEFGQSIEITDDDLPF